MTKPILAIALAAALSIPAARAADSEAADAAFAAGDHERALALYDEVLASSPDDLHALVRTGKLLSWAGRYEDAIARYDRALAVDPRHFEAALERAKVLSWSKRFGEAAESFRILLRRDPEHREARLGLARSLSWGGRQRSARAEYEKILAARPSDADALLGLAQTHAWADDADGAEGALDALDRVRPDDPDAAALRASIRRGRLPWILVGVDRVDDTDDNAITTPRVEGGLGFPAGFDLRLGVARYDLETGPLEGTIDSLYGELGWKPAPRHRLEARVGTDRLRGSSGPRESEATYGLGYAFPIGERGSGRVAWDREPYRYSVPIVDNRIVGDLYTARAAGPLGDRWRIEGGVGRWDLSDGNERDAADVSLLHAWRLREHTLEAGYGFRGFDWALDLGNGYFDPSSFTAHLALFRARGPVGAKGDYDLSAEAGVQSFTEGGSKVSADPVVGASATLGRPLGESVRIEGYAAYSTFAQQGGEDWRSRRVGVRFRFTLGGTP